MSRQGLKLAFLNCEDTEGWSNLSDYWRSAFSHPDDEWIEYRVFKDELPNEKEISTFDGFLIPGSHHAAYDDDKLQWIGEMQKFVRLIGAASMEENKDPSARLPPRIIGGCFGAQILAHSLGGRTARLSSGKFVFRAELIQVTDKFAPFVDSLVNQESKEQQPDLSEMYTGPGQITLLESHGDGVEELAPNSTVLASSPGAKYEVFMIGNNILCHQGHPEWSVSELQDKIMPKLLAKGMLNEEEAAAAVTSFKNNRLSHASYIKVARAFLRREPIQL